MSSIRDAPIALDTNQFVFGLRGHSSYPECAELLRWVGELKIFVSKSMHVNEGETISLAPMRYLIYFGDKAPIEVNHLPKQETATVI